MSKSIYYFIRAIAVPVILAAVAVAALVWQLGEVIAAVVAAVFIWDAVQRGGEHLRHRRAIAAGAVDRWYMRNYQHSLCQRMSLLSALDMHGMGEVFRRHLRRRIHMWHLVPRGIHKTQWWLAFFGFRRPAPQQRGTNE